MNVILVEDEYSATQNMLALLAEVGRGIRVLACLESIDATVGWLGQNPRPDLAFFDIQLADGLSFDIVQQTKVDFPIIFTTAYHEYALRAFKVNSIDYLLKPIVKTELAAAIDKYKRLQSVEKTDQNLLTAIDAIRKRMARKKTMLIKRHDGFLPIPVSDFACFYTETTLIYGLTFSNQTLLLDENLDTLESQLSQDDFFRVNRQMIIARTAIKAVQYYLNGRLLLKPAFVSNDEILVSKARAGEFKKWLEQ